MGRSRSVRKDQRYPALLERPVHSILVVKPRAIGDVLLSTIVTPNLRAAFPAARITFLTEAPAADIIRDNPYIDDALIFRPGKDSFIALLSELYRAKHDLVFDLFCNPRSAQMTAATRAALRVGYPFRGRAWAYNIHVETRADSVHNTQFNLDPLRSLDIPIVSETLVFHLPEERRRRMRGVADSFRLNPGPLIAMNSSGTWSTKRWPLDHFASLADKLVSAYQANVVLLWGPEEKDDVEYIASATAQGVHIAPDTSIGELGALLASCDFMISNDSGPMHIAAAVEVPTLGIFGPTRPELQGPWNTESAWVRLEELHCLGCNLTSCDIGNICMRDLPVDTVFQAFHSLRGKVTS